jgi:3-hydroxybutyryl-CoA dehydratase
MRTLAFLAIKEWSFKEPVFVGDTIRVHTKIVNKTERGKGRFGVVTWHRQLTNQDGKIVQEGTTETLVEGRANLRQSKTESS